ncbi:flagellar rod assembly protein/muramidase FlgJ [Oceanisphaera marina]|uniref:Peptidoglycan hydrolase FlgJ n=1 Tax=Oceanisphaera marina TaxID=2017550 RepID=A0ABQ1ILF7_9GAMM|nr:flagellar assembly peptidoglycan hydrolase FlgJ [Oceanisphaera marina]GGB45036.1 flagellar rod assembly protein/muramidase FlgJ [Oceanisphaera marina]
MKPVDSYSNSLLANDIQGLDKLRQQGFAEDRGKALDEAARQFESLFTQQLFKSMRAANKVFEADGPMNSRYTEYYQDMHDQQMSAELSKRGSLGLADLVSKQLGGEQPAAQPEARHFDLTDVRRIQGKVVRPLGADAVAEAVEKAKQGARPPLQAAADNPADSLLANKALPGSSLSNNKNAVTYSASEPFRSPEDFVRRLMPAAVAAGKRMGLPPEAMLAQAALETGWGKKIIGPKNSDSSHNLFGIKADNSWNNAKKWVNTLEYEQGIAVKVKAPFRAYGSFNDSFNDYVDFLHQNPRYGEALQQTDSPRQYFKALQEAGYATDPKYADKLSSIFNTVTRLAAQA